MSEEVSRCDSLFRSVNHVGNYVSSTIYRIKWPGFISLAGRQRSKRCRGDLWSVGMHRALHIFVGSGSPAARSASSPMTAEFGEKGEDAVTEENPMPSGVVASEL